SRAALAERVLHPSGRIGTQGGSLTRASWQRTATPSHVRCTSVSMLWTPASRAASNEGSVFSGLRARAPRWPCKLKEVDITLGRVGGMKKPRGDSRTSARHQREKVVSSREACILPTHPLM